MIPPLFDKQEVVIWRVTKLFPQHVIPIWSLWPNIRFLPSIDGEKNGTKHGHIQNVCSMCIKISKVGKQEVGIWRIQKRFPQYVIPIWSLWPNTRFLSSIVAEKNGTKMCIYKCMFNVYQNQLSRQTGSSNRTDPKMLPTISYTSMTLVTKYQISAVNSYWEKCDDNYLERTGGRSEGRKDGQTDRGKTVFSPPPSGSWGILRYVLYCLFYHTPICIGISLSVV